MKKIVFTLVALAGLLSASEYVNINNGVVEVSDNSNVVSVFRLEDISYMSNNGSQNTVVLKQPNSVILIKENSTQNQIAQAYSQYLAMKK